MERFRVGIDIGGTFTDAVIREVESGRTSISKTLSTPGRLHEAVLEGLKKALADASAQPTDCTIAHGSTVAVNAVIERKGARIGVLVTAGFRDILEIGRQRRTSLYDLDYDKPVPTVPRRLTAEVRGRIDAAGEVVEPLAIEDVEAAIDLFRAEGVQAVAIGLLNSYRNPLHEQQAAEAIHRVAPGLAVVLSSEICPEFREYERLSTATMSAYVAPLIDAYLGTLEEGLRERRYPRRLSIMQSNGGIADSHQVRRKPLETLFSGPAGGVVMAAARSAECGFDNVLTFDMGGTSCDVSLVAAGQPLLTAERTVSGHPVRISSVDIETIGAGGGSIARVDADGVLAVGPESAGAVPGPACYGGGGTDPTVTDADLVLGIIDAGTFLGGAVGLDMAAARRSIEDGVAGPLGFDVLDAAEGIYRVVNANMAAVARLVSIERGWDPRDFTLVAYGGAAPGHAVDVARMVGIPTVLIPPFPSAGSAWGMLVAPVQHDYVRTCYGPASAFDVRKGNELVDGMRAEAEQDLADQLGGPPRIELTADMRYSAQSYELRIPLSGARFDGEMLSRGVEDFHEEHQRLYGHSSRDDPVHVVNLRLRALSLRDLGKPEARPGEFRRARGRTSRRIHFGGCGLTETAVYARDDLPSGTVLEGPAVVEEYGAVTLIPPESRAEVASSGSLVIQCHTGKDPS